MCALSAAAVLLFLTGCAANSGVVAMGEGKYMVSRQAAKDFSGSGTLKAEALQEADQFCSKQHKTFKVLSSKEAHPPYIFTNFPKAEIEFICVDAQPQSSQ